MRYTATLKVTFELKEGQTENLTNIVLTREVGTLKHSIEHGVGIAPTGVVPGSAKVEIVSGPTKE
jgi:hypothetical protein